MIIILNDPDEATLHRQKNNIFAFKSIYKNCYFNFFQQYFRNVNIIKFLFAYLLKNNHLYFFLKGHVLKVIIWFKKII